MAESPETDAAGDGTATATRPVVPMPRHKRWIAKIRREGLGSVLASWAAGRRDRFLYSNWLAGRIVELRNNRVSYHGLTITLDNPTIPTPHKSGLFFGRYETDEAKLLRLLPADEPVVELGGSIGVIACLSNRRLADPARHVVVEANPRLIPTLRENRDLNGCRFTIEEAAVAYGANHVTFSLGPSFVTGHLHGTAGETVRVPATTLDALMRKHGFDVTNLIMDIEGAETFLVEHESDVLRDRVSTIIMETHERMVGDARNDAMLTRLDQSGFDVIGQSGCVLALRNRNLQEANRGPLEVPR